MTGEQVEYKHLPPEVTELLARDVALYARRIKLTQGATHKEAAARSKLLSRLTSGELLGNVMKMTGRAVITWPQGVHFPSNAVYDLLPDEYLLWRLGSSVEYDGARRPVVDVQPINDPNIQYIGVIAHTIEIANDEAVALTKASRNGDT